MQWNRSLFLFATIGLLVWQSCVKDKPSPGGGDEPAENQHPKVFIANEGVFGNGNASLSFIDLEEHKVFNNIFGQKNERVLGDVLQSIYGDEKNLYLLVNNSNKIVVVDKKSFEYLGEIPVQQPRYMVFIGEGKALVSSMYRSRLYIVDLEGRRVESEVPLNFNNTEGMLEVDDKVYIAPWSPSCNYVYQFDKGSRSIEDSIYISGFAPTSMVLDKNGKVWVLAGNPHFNVASTLTQIDPGSKQILKSITFPAGAETIKPVTNPEKDAIYYLGVDYNGNSNAYNGLFKINIDADAAPTEPILRAHDLQYFWGLGVDPGTGKVYLGDPKGWIQSGTVSELTPEGGLVNTFTVGLGPCYFYFD